MVEKYVVEMWVVVLMWFNACGGGCLGGLRQVVEGV